MSIRVAFTLFRDESWTGGLNYLRNLFSALAELPGRPVVPLLFIAPGAKAGSLTALRPYLMEEPVEVAGWSDEYRWSRLASLCLLQRDAAAVEAFRTAGVDLVFRNEGWDGFASPFPILAWIADFQHCHLPGMFSRIGRLKRDMKFSAYCRVADRIMVSSQDALQDCEHFFTASKGKARAVPFAVEVPQPPALKDTQAVVQGHGLPERFVYFPGQLWRHKNHGVVVQALQRLRDEGLEVTVVSTGNPVDGRHPDHPRAILSEVERRGLTANFRFLGLVPYAHIGHLMRASMAVLNPSLFEGWSTTVEEAKSQGVRMILSDLRVHREQAGDCALFFDPQDAQALADRLRQAWAQWTPGPDLEREAVARAGYLQARRAYGECFARLAQETVQAAGRSEAY